VLEYVPAAVHPGPLPVPHREYAVVLRAWKQVQLLRAPDGGGGEVFVHAGLEPDVMIVEMLLGPPQGLVEAAEG
jgi:hypothetical protein